jgi:hypothetical protein
MNALIAELFERAGCTGQLCVQSLDGGQEIAVDADREVVAASVFKVSVALEAETQFADGRLPPCRPGPRSRTRRARKTRSTSGSGTATP